MSQTLSQRLKTQQLIFTILVFLLASTALFSIFKEGNTLSQVGFQLILAVVLLFIQSFNRKTATERSEGRSSAFIGLLIGLLLVNATLLRNNALYLFVIALFGLDMIRQYRFYTERKKHGLHYTEEFLAASGNLLVVVGLLLFKERAVEFLVGIAGALRIAGIGVDIWQSEVGSVNDAAENVVEMMGLQENTEIAELAEKIESEESARAIVDIRWIITLLAILFFIHLGRIGLDRSSFGLLSHFVALIGDMVIALVISFLIIFPVRVLVRKLTRPLELKLWRWVQAVPLAQRKFWSARTFVEWLLETRLRTGIRIQKSSYSFPTAIRTGLQLGLPFAALLAAIIPVFGMSWYFDTENWASGIWDGWAAKRTDVWRSAMVQKIQPHPTAADFTVKLPNFSDTTAYSMVIVGDPGEGDASQLVLHDQIVKVSEQERVKFVVISSDVVYPDGAMKDYEKNFWLPMKGVTKPVYAIPGNHDWYDALEGFAATFYEPDAALQAMRARREADLSFTLRKEESMKQQISQAAQYRNWYQVPTGFQKAPFFHFQTKDFALIAIETGVMRRIDSVQMAWLRSCLAAAKGKFKVALLGHPFYAIGEYQGSMNEDFTALHQLLREEGVQVAMAGDTHDLEYYVEPPKANRQTPMYHFVNGGGGAYLSIGAALKPRNQMPEQLWAHYPATAPLISKIEGNNNWMKKPAWLWTKRFDGWPFSAEWLSAAFDYNVAPFFQSFMEICVEPAKQQIRFIAYGPNGPLLWRDLDAAAGVKPADVGEDAPVEWVFPLR